MNVHYPDRSKGSSIVTIPGSGRHSLLALSAPQQKAVDMFGLRLVGAGYAVFAANHRTAPLNNGPAPLEGAGGRCVSCATMQDGRDRSRQDRGRWWLVRRAPDADNRTPKLPFGSRCLGPGEQREQQGAIPRAVATAHQPNLAQRALRPRDAGNGTRPEDSAVPIQHAELLAEAMRRSGVTSEVLFVPRAASAHHSPARQPPRTPGLRQPSTGSTVTCGTDAASPAAPSNSVAARSSALFLARNADVGFTRPSLARPLTPGIVGRRAGTASEPNRGHRGRVRSRMRRPSPTRG